MAHTDSARRPYKAICFDLDGTLLPMDLDRFLHDYYARIGRFAGSKGLDAKTFMGALDAGVRAMMTHADGATNHDAFWDAFYEAYPESKGVAEAVATEFYETDFDRIGDDVAPHPGAQEALEALKRKGYRLVLTTMPLFPRIAVERRLGWAGVDPTVFEYVTSYDNSTSIKPKAEYYQENLDRLGLAGEEVLMVGNNTLEDLSFTELGADAYLVTDCLLNPNDFDIDAVEHGTFAEFCAWAHALPACEAVD